MSTFVTLESLVVPLMLVVIVIPNEYLSTVSTKELSVIMGLLEMVLQGILATKHEGAFVTHQRLGVVVGIWIHVEKLTMG